MIGNKIYKLAKRLFPINRSITGNGTRKTLEILKDHNENLKIKSIPSGSKVFDWVIPYEWNVKDAWIKDSRNKKIVDIKKNNLHLMSYSIPVNKRINIKELKKNLYSIRAKPNAIPYVTSYYEKKWGFCLSYNQLKKLKDKFYTVKIDSELKKGFLNYGEILIKGKSKKEILLSTYICHPSMANNELSGPCVAIFLSKWINSIKSRNYSYRLVFVPEKTSSIKVDAIKRSGCEVRFFGIDGVDTENFARKYALENNLTFLSPYNDNDVISGQGTCGVEILEQLPECNAVFIAVGGGGLISGIASHIKSIKEDVEVIGCQPIASAVMAHSIKAGKILDLESESTLSDGTAGGIEKGAITFELCQQLVDYFELVSEAKIIESVQTFIDTHRMLIEGAAGVALAGLLAQKEHYIGKKVVIVICGGNISRQTLKTII